MYLISYDIENDRLRLKIAQTLIRWGLHRVQYSVFMGSLEKAAITKLWADLQPFTNQKAWAPADSILFAPISPKHQKDIKFIGAWPERWEEMSGTINTLMF